VIRIILSYQNIAFSVTPEYTSPRYTEPSTYSVENTILFHTTSSYTGFTACRKCFV